MANEPNVKQLLQKEIKRINKKIKELELEGLTFKETTIRTLTNTPKKISAKRVDELRKFGKKELRKLSGRSVTKLSRAVEIIEKPVQEYNQTDKKSAKPYTPKPITKNLKALDKPKTEKTKTNKTKNKTAFENRAENRKHIHENYIEPPIEENQAVIDKPTDYVEWVYNELTSWNRGKPRQMGNVRTEEKIDEIENWVAQLLEVVSFIYVNEEERLEANERIKWSEKIMTEDFTLVLYWYEGTDSNFQNVLQVLTGRSLSVPESTALTNMVESIQGFGDIV